MKKTANKATGVKPSRVAKRKGKPAAGDPGTPGPVRRWFENPAMLCPMCEKPTHIQSAGKDRISTHFVRCFTCAPVVPADGPVEFATEADIAELRAFVATWARKPRR